MNIAIIHPAYPGSSGSGASIHATKIAEALQTRGHAITIYCTKSPTSKQSRSIGFEYEVLKPSSYPYQAHLQMNNEVKQSANQFDEFDIVHAHSSQFIPAMAQIGANTNTRTIVTLHSYTGICPKAVGQLEYMNQKSCNENGFLKCSMCSIATLPKVKKHGYDIPTHLTARAARILLQHRSRSQLDAVGQFHVLSPHMKTKYDEFGFPAGQITVIPDIVDERFLIEHQSDFNEPYQLLSVGRLSHRKGADKLIPLLYKLDQVSLKNFELTIIGDGVLRSKIEQQVCNFGFEDEVTIAGQVQNGRLPEIYASHDLFVYLGSFDEPFGMVLLESLAAGTPVISTNVGNIGNIIQEGGIVIPDNIESGAIEISDLLGTEQLEQMSINAKKQAEKHEKDEIATQFENMYQNSTS